MSRLSSHYELVSDKSNNPLTSTPYIKHGEKWLDEMLNESDERIDAVESGVAANAEAISQNTTNISTNTTNISGLDTRVTALEQGGGGGGGGDNVGRIDRTEGATQHGEIFNMYTDNGDSKANRATGYMSHAEGVSTQASGACSHAEGSSTTASGSCSHAEGASTSAFGYYSHAEGFNTQATASGSHAEGNGARAFKEAAHAEGVQTTADGLYAHAEGNYTTASAEAAHAEGKNSIASGLYSHAEGEYTYAEDWGAHSEGKNTTASGKYSHAENSYNEALGENSHAEGNYTISSGYRTHTEGFHTKASGDNAHAEGYYTKASSNNQHVSGTANIEDKANKYAVIVGNGLWEGNESNAYTLDWQGNAWYAGDVTGNKDGEEYKLSDMKDKYTLPEGGIPASDLAEGVLPTVTDEYNPEGTAAVSGKAVAAAISAIPTPMQFKGTLGTGGTKTSLPTAEASNEGHTYRVITTGTYASQAAKVGDVFVSNGSAWIHIPAGDDAANSIVMTNYTSDKSSAGTSAIANTDTVTKAIGKVDNRLGNAETEIEKKVNKTSVSSSENTTRIVPVPEDVDCFAGIGMIGGKTVKMVNLWDMSAMTIYSTTPGVTIDVDDNDIATINAANWTANGYISNVQYIPIEYGKTYVAILEHLSGRYYKKDSSTTDSITGFQSTETETIGGSGISDTVSYSKIATNTNIGVNVIEYTPISPNAKYLRLAVWSNGTTGGGAVFDNLKIRLRFYEKTDNTIEEYVPYGNYLWNAPVESIVLESQNFTPDRNKLEYKKYTSTGELVADRAVLAYAPVDVVVGKKYTIFGLKPNSDFRVVQWNDTTLRSSSVVKSDTLGHYTFTATGNRFAMNVLYVVIASDIYTTEENKPYTKTELSLAELAEKLPDYGKSAGNVYNYIDNERGVYVHCVKGYKFSDLNIEYRTADQYVGANYFRSPIPKIAKSYLNNAICATYERISDRANLATENNKFAPWNSNGDMVAFSDSSCTSLQSFLDKNINNEFIYELAQPEEIPLSSLISPLVVEPGGTIEFVNEHNLDVPNKVIYKKEV